MVLSTEFSEKGTRTGVKFTSRESRRMSTPDVPAGPSAPAPAVPAAAPQAAAEAPEAATAIEAPEPVVATAPNTPASRPTERPIITKLELENFKSYAGLKTIGPYHHRFNSIIGPNGSGKSNVIDAMLFVFGKRAKKLRLKKVSELIHNSAEFPDCTFARVNVHFVNVIDKPDGSGVEPVPGTECVISRVAKKDNSSKYLIDNKTATFAEVAEKLDERNIDLKNNRFLILQGEVEQISQMPPLASKPGETGLLEYLEEIIGSNVYVEPIAKASEVYDSAEESRTQTKNRMRAAEKTREGLRGSRDEVVAYHQAQRDVSRRQNLLWHKHRQARIDEARSVEGEVAALEASTEAKQKQLAESEAEIKEREEAVKFASKAHAKLEKQCDEWREKYATFERKDVKMREDLKHNKGEKKKFSTLRKKHGRAVQICRSEVERLKEEAPLREEAIKEANAAQDAAQERVEIVEKTLKGKTEALRSDLAEARKKLKPLGAAADKCKAELDECKAELDLITSRSEDAKKKSKAADKALASARETVSGHGEAVAALHEEKTTKTTRLDAAEAEIVEAKKAEEEAEIQVAETRKCREACQQKMLAAQAAHDEASVLVTAASSGKSSDRDSAVPHDPMLMALRSEDAGVGSDLLGRLGHLGGIDRKYDVAVSTACPALTYLVTETVDGAQKCIDFLRANNLGRATFIVLEKIQYLQDKMDLFAMSPQGTSVSKAKNVARLFDLVSVGEDEDDQRLRVAFYYALRDTLVCKDLDQAVAVAYDGDKCIHRVVTLAGELIERSGTMAGGGGKARSGLMGEKPIPRKASPEEQAAEAARIAEEIKLVAARREKEELEMKKLEEELREIEAAHRAQCKVRDEARSKRRNLEKEIRNLKQALKKLTTKAGKMELDLKAAEQNLPDLERNAAELKKLTVISADEKAQISTLTRQLDEKKRAFADASKASAGLELRVGMLQKRIMDVGGSELKDAKKALKKAVEDVKKATAAIGKAEVDIKALEKKAIASEEACAQASKDHDAVVQTMQATIEDLKKLDALASECVETFNEVQAAEQEKKDEVSTAAAALAAVQKRSKSLRAEHEKYKMNYDALAEKFGKIQHEIIVWDEKIEALKHEAESQYSLVQNMMEDKTDQGKNSEADQNGSADSEDDDADANMKGTETDDVETSSTEEQADSSTVKKEVLPAPTMEQIAMADILSLEKSIAVLEEKVTALRETVDMGAIAAFNEADADWRKCAEKFDEATAARDEARSAYEELRKKRLETFMSGFGVITLKLKEMYQMITLGGDAELELVDTLDPFAEGIVFSVRPRGKSWKNIANLSGGEKTLSSLALVFALHHYKPTPLYVMDEIDAALDFRNVSIVANYIKERTRNAQFIIISLRNNMFELADRLVGIYKTNNSTKSVAINPKKIAIAASKAAAVSQNGPVAVPLGERNH